jgi:tetratricopeptide (TPR) repeat protein
MSMSTYWVIFAVLPTLLLARGEFARADERAPSAEQIERAKKLFALGQAHITVEKYDLAMQDFEESYALVPRPALLFNIATVARFANLSQKAIDYYQRYLASTKAKGSRSAEAQKWLAELTRSPVPSRNAELPRPASPVETTPPVALPATPVALPATKSASETTDAAPVAPAAPARNERPGRTKKLVGVALATTGVALVAAGIGLAAASASVSDELTADGQAGKYSASKYRRGRDEQIAAGVLLGIGGAAVVGGAVTALFGLREQRAQRTVSFVPWISGNTFGLGMAIQ